jgi:hypothetical protein
MLNDINIDECEFHEIPVNQMEKDRIKKNVKKSMLKKRNSYKKKLAIAASLSVIILSTTISIKPALASNIPIVGDLIKNNLISVNSEYSNYIDVIGKTKSSGGIDVTLDSAIADDNRLVLSLTIKNNNEDIKDSYIDGLLNPTSLKVNGKRVSTDGGASYEFVDKNTIKVLEKIDWANDKKANKMNIDIDIPEMFGKKGDWGAKFSLDKSKQVEKTVAKNINKKFQYDGKSGQILSVNYSPLTVTIRGNGEIYAFDKDKSSSFIVLDDKGVGLLWDGSVGSSPQDVIPELRETFISNPNTKNITIIPVYTTRAQKETDKLPPVQLDLQNKRPIVLPIDEDRSVLIKDYFIEDGYLVMKYVNEYFGKESYRQFCDASIYLTANGTELEFPNDDKAKLLEQKYTTLNQCLVIYKIEDSQNIMIGTYDMSNVKILKDLSTTIQVK